MKPVHDFWQQLLDLVGGEGTYPMAQSEPHPDPQRPWAVAGYGLWDEQRGQAYMISLHPDRPSAELSLFDGDDVEPVWLMDLESGRLHEITSRLAPLPHSDAK